MTGDTLDAPHLPTPEEAEAIADEIARQLTRAFGGDGRPSAETSIHLTRARWAAILALLRERSPAE